MSEATPKAARLALWLPLAMFAGFVVLITVALMWPAQREVQSAMIGKPLPAFSLQPAVPAVPGATLADLSGGKPRLVNIFASWCVPCAVEAPQLAALQREGVEIVGVAIRDRPEDVARFLAQHGNPFVRIGADPRSSLQIAIGSSGVPETFVIDGRGTIRYQHIGEIRPEHLPLLRAELAKAAS